ncbi:MAG: hypothetical protein COS85_22525 [Armatimonadetes bacterium CG07_land_8_20_14_0_80_59_28]|nr:MAG: hypothetical protein COS85_22525 [Armatimonadetes bacterium CG07_land_8_20_14_0_80_59_28]
MAVGLVHLCDDAVAIPLVFHTAAESIVREIAAGHITVRKIIGGEQLATHRTLQLPCVGNCGLRIRANGPTQFIQPRVVRALRVDFRAVDRTAQENIHPMPAWNGTVRL